MLQKVHKETKLAAVQSSEDINDDEDFNDSSNKALDGPQNILKYTSLVDVANKVMKGYYEGCELTQARNFYKEVIGDEGKYKLDQKITETLVHDTIRKLKNYETEYQAKLTDFINEYTDVEMKNQALKSDQQVFENDLYVETAKNKSNSGEFVGGAYYFSLSRNLGRKASRARELDGASNSSAALRASWTFPPTDLRYAGATRSI